MNNKGFAITTILYGILILFLMLLLSMLGMLSSYKDRLSMLIDNNNGSRCIVNKNCGGIAKYTITYDANGGSGAPGSVTVLSGETITISDTVPTNNHYSFVGWATSADATKIKYKARDTLVVNSNATLYAVWGYPYYWVEGNNDYTSDGYLGGYIPIGGSMVVYNVFQSTRSIYGVQGAEYDLVNENQFSSATGEYIGTLVKLTLTNPTGIVKISYMDD